jgi:hypothetical protein
MNLRNVKTATTVRPKRRAIVLLSLSLSAVLGITASGCFTGPSRDVLSSGHFTDLPSLSVDADAGARYVPFSVPSAGVLDVKLDWNSSANNVDIALVKGATVLAANEGPAKPARFSYTVAAGQFEVVILNWGPGQESGSWEVAFTPDK